MKRTVSIILAFLMIFSVLLSTASCGKSNAYNDWSMAGLSFSLPKNMRRLVAADYEAFENQSDKTKVMIYFYKDSDFKNNIGEGASVSEYSEFFVKKEGVTVISELFDEKKNTVTLTYKDPESGRFCYDVIIRNDTMIYHVRMSCEPDLEKSYIKQFKKWAKKINCNEELINYAESGLYFSLPEYMKKINVSYGDVVYSNNDSAEFIVYFYSAESLLTEYYLPMESTVKEYWDWFRANNGYENVEEVYDEEEKKITLKYEYVDELNNEELFLYDVIMRNSDSLIHVTFCCDLDKRDIYEHRFDEWAKHLALIYKDK